MSTCGSGCRWLARVLRFGRSRTRVHWPRRVAGEILARLPGTPVRAYRQGGHLVHPPLGLSLDEAARTGVLVGAVEAAWLEPGGIAAHLHLADEAHVLRRWLLEIERRGQVPVMGLSIHTRGQVREHADIGGPAQTIITVSQVVALDLVTAPSADGALLRSLPAPTLSHTERTTR